MYSDKVDTFDVYALRHGCMMLRLRSFTLLIGKFKQK